MLEVFTSYWGVAEDLLGFSPLLMLPVFALVSLLDNSLRLRDRVPNWRNSILGALCILSGAGVSLFVEYEGGRELATNAAYLGSISSLTYQIFKGLHKGVKSWVESKIEDKFNINIKIED